MTYTIVGGPDGEVNLYQDGHLHDIYESEADCQDFLDRVRRTDQIEGKLDDWVKGAAVEMDLTYDEVLEEVAHYASHNLLWQHRHPSD